MNIGDEILVKVKVIDFDSNPHGSAIKVEVTGFIDREEERTLKAFNSDRVRFWIHRLDQPNVIVNDDPV